MMEEDKTTLAVQVILDDSGSMGCIRKQVTEGLNGFLSELAKSVAPANVTITLFQDQLEGSLVKDAPVYDLPKIRKDAYNPRSATEDIAFSVKQGLARLEKANAHQKVLVVVTDGLNASSHMAGARAEIQKRMAEGWLVLWLGVWVYEDYKERLLKYARDIGIPKDLVLSFSGYDFAKVMPLVAKSALRFSASGGDIGAASLAGAA